MILISIHPNPKHFNKLAEVDEVVEHLIKKNEGKWTMDNGQDIHLDLTGGEILGKSSTLNYSNIPMRDLKMLHLKQTLHNLHDDFANYPQTQDRFAVPWFRSQNLVLVENLGILLYCPDVHEYSPC